MRRRRFLIAAGAILATSRSHAQPARRTFRIGWLSSGAPAPAGTRSVAYEAFAGRMRELGYEEGRNLVVEQRYGEGDLDLAGKRAVELVRSNVDVILAGSTSAAAAAIKATRTIPVVMGSAANPVAAGLLANLSRPGGNLTGLTLDTADTTAKRLQLLKEALPRLRRAAALHPADIRAFPVIAEWLKANEAAAELLGLSLVPVDLPQARRELWDGVFKEVVADGARAATIVETPTYLAYRATLAGLALKYRLPMVFPFREQAEAGGLMAYGADVADLYRRAAEYVDKILKGASPADLPVEQPTKFNLIVNLKTAKALGLALPASILARADNLIR